IESERAKIDFRKPDSVPSILFVEEALGLARLSKTGRDPYRAPLSASAPRQPRRVESANDPKGLKILTDIPAVLEARNPRSGPPAATFPLDEIVAFKFDGENRTWTVQTAAGKLVQAETLEVGINRYRLAVLDSETPQAFADRLAKTSLGNVTPAVRTRVV